DGRVSVGLVLELVGGLLRRRRAVDRLPAEAVGVPDLDAERLTEGRQVRQTEVRALPLQRDLRGLVGAGLEDDLRHAVGRQVLVGVRVAGRVVARAEVVAAEATAGRRRAELQLWRRAALVVDAD